MGTVSDATPTSTDMAQAALAALARAGLRAAEDARRTNTCTVVAENGKVLHLSQQDHMRQRGQLETTSVPEEKEQIAPVQCIEMPKG